MAANAARFARFLRVDAEVSAARGVQLDSMSSFPTEEAISMTMFKTLGLLGVFGSLALAACSKNEAKPEPEKVTAEPAAPAVAAPDPAAEAAYAAKTVFQSKCVVCHGSSGVGDGPGAAALNPKPRAFADGAWQASVGDEQIENTILMGGAAVGKSPAMPGNPDLQAKPEVVKELVKIVRGFKKG